MKIGQSKFQLSRRKFVGLSLAASATTAFGQGTVIGLLAYQQGYETIRNIVESHYGPIKDDEFFKSFFQHLQQSAERVESFHKLMSQKELRKQLNTYVIEEFAVRTNYFEVQVGESKNLHLLVG